MDRRLTVANTQIPRLIYGTAWKEERTKALTASALEAGFRGIDTANQRRHYHEAAVGEAVQDALQAGTFRREELFLQTKFTFLAGQDEGLPYDPKAPVADQVAQSFASSLHHLGVDRLDALLLHGPSSPGGIMDADRQAWASMERLHQDGRVALLGVSNVSLEQLQEIHRNANVKPAIVQNRCFTRPGADEAVRRFCNEHGLAYQGFSLLTAIAPVLRHPKIEEISRRTGGTPAQVIFRYALQSGIVVLTGTTSQEHMKEDLDAFDLHLEDDEVRAIESLVSGTRRA